MADVKTVRAYAKDVDIAPRKVSIVASLVRNRTVADALVILDHVPRRSALPVKKAIQSAAANAQQAELDSKTLVISQLSVTIGRRLKRFKPHMRGMARPFQKKSSNILVEVSGSVKPKTKKAAVKKTDVNTQATKEVAAKEEKK